MDSAVVKSDFWTLSKLSHHGAWGGRAAGHNYITKPTSSTGHLTRSDTAPYPSQTAFPSQRYPGGPHPIWPGAGPGAGPRWAWWTLAHKASPAAGCSLLPHGRPQGFTHRRTQAPGQLSSQAKSNKVKEENRLRKSLRHIIHSQTNSPNKMSWSYLMLGVLHYPFPLLTEINEDLLYL